MSSWSDDDFNSTDPLTRFNAHQAAKGRTQLPDPDLARKREREAGRAPVPAREVFVCESPLDAWVQEQGSAADAAAGDKEAS